MTSARSLVLALSLSLSGVASKVAAQSSIPLTIKSLGPALTNAAVFTGVPFPPNVLADADQIDLIISNQSVPRQVQTLSTYPNGSQRVVLLGYRVSLAAGQTLAGEVRYGTNGIVLAPSMTWTRNLNVLTLLPPTWYGSSTVFGLRFEASTNNTLFPAFETRMVSQFTVMSDPPNDTDPDQRNYYDHVHAIYMTLLRSGGPTSAWQRAWNEVQQYRENEILPSGPYAGQYNAGSHTNNAWPMIEDVDDGTVRRMYTQGLLDDYYLSGDPRSLAVAKEIGDDLLLDAHLQPSARWTYTERASGYAIAGLTALFEATMNPNFLDAANQIGVIAMDHQDAMAIKYPNQGGVAGQTGGFIQDFNGHWFDPTESTVSGAGSPFMTSILAEGMTRLYWLTADPRVSNSLVRVADWLADAAYLPGEQSYIYICVDPAYGGTVPLNPMFLQLLGFGYQVTGQSKYLNQASAILSANGWGRTIKEYNQGMRSSGQGLYLLQRPPHTVPLTLGMVVSAPGDLNGDTHVTGADALLMNQELVGLRNPTDTVFKSTGFLNGDVNQSGQVSGADSLLVNQVLVSLRSHVVSKIVPGSRTNNAATFVTIYGVGFPTNAVSSVSIGPPVNLALSNVVVVSREKITAIVPAGGGTGTGTVNVVATPTNGVMSFGRFVNP